MSASRENVRVVSNEGRLPDASKPVPQGEYDGYIDWHNKDRGEPYMTAVQLVIDKNRLAKMGKSDGIPFHAIRGAAICKIWLHRARRLAKKTSN